MIEGIVGVIHLPAMAGDPGYRGGGSEQVIEFALGDAMSLVEGGVDGLILENFGSSPFRKGDASSRIDPYQVSVMTLVAAELRRRWSLPIGVNCLRNDAQSALGIAAAVGLDFIRVNVHTGAYVTDQGLIEGEAHDTLRYRSAHDAGRVAIVADVLVKHAAPLAPLSADTATKDCLLRGRADAVVVTGSGTGAPVDPELVREVVAAAGAKTVLLGSGTTPETLATLGPLVDGAIVGTFFKRGGVVSEPVEVARVRQLVAAAAGVWRARPQPK